MSQRRSVLSELLRSFSVWFLRLLLLRLKSKKRGDEPPENYGGTD